MKLNIPDGSWANLFGMWKYDIMVQILPKLSRDWM